ncbi:MAG: imidazoleglycerol-phosphate dehydratase [Candidatus Omnitrophica bacterium]|nr:imidazoleglycerol-phosphate dehydratase [Candidatus Omnitrophota bacterium]
MSRTAQIERKSKETQITAVLNIDGTGKSKIKTPIGFLDHMLELFSFHGFFDLELTVTGDTHIDIHHTNEDIGIVLGKAFKKALGEEKAGIKRFGHAFAPMEATVGLCVIDISGRGFYKFNSEELIPAQKGTEGYEFSHFEHFMESFAHNLGATLSFTLQNPSEDLHTNLETMFKSLGLALDEAVKVDSRRLGEVPSTKGIID